MTAPQHQRRNFLGDARGAAAVEFAIWLTMLLAPIMSVVDIGFFIHERMQLENAAHAAAQTAWVVCDPSSGAYLPAATNCLNAPLAIGKVRATAQTTSLGTLVTLHASAEGYYCADSSGNLSQGAGWRNGVVTFTTSGNTAPSGGTLNCSSLGGAFTGNVQPSGDYLLVTVGAPYSSPFKGLSIVTALLPNTTTLTETAWVRLQ